MRQYAKKLVENERFEKIIIIVIIINTVVLGLLTSDNFSPQVILVLEIINKICIGIYIIEAIIKLFAWHLSYFKNGWNIFDFLIITMTLISNAGIFNGIRFFRIFRIFRSLAAFRLISSFKQLRKIVQAMILSLSGIGWTVLLMLSIYFIFAIIGIDLFKNDFPELFGSFPAAFVTLFSLTTMEGWQDTVFPVVEIMPFAWFYFLIFFVVAAFVLLDLIVGIIVDNISAVSAKEEDESGKPDEIKQLLEKMSSIEDKLNKIINEKEIK
jgi:voltage-gated sodium channel